MGLFGAKRTKTDKALTRMLAGAEVPTFPHLTARILRRVRDPETEIDGIVESLQWDPALVVRILRTVNTAAFGPASPIHSVQHAVSYMGRAQLEQIVLALAVREALPQAPAASFEPRRFWLSASRRAVLARAISDRLHPSVNEECFTAGLLQDMAVPVLAHSRPGEYGPLLASWNAGGPKLEELEREVFGWTHAEAGGLLGRMWDLPENLAQSIFRHHRLDVTDAQLRPALKLVSVLRESSSEHGIEAFLETGRTEYGLESDWLRDALDHAERQAEELAGLLA